MLKKQIRIAISSTALICSLGYATGAFAADGWEVVKKSNDIVGLINNLKGTDNVKKTIDALVANINSKNVALTKAISENEKNLKQLATTISKSNLSIEAARNSKSRKTSIDAIKTMQSKIATLKSDGIANKATQTVLQSHVKDLVSQKTTVLNDFATISKADDFLKTLDAFGKIVTVADLAIEASQFGERVNNGSTAWLEGLTLTLKAVESFQPTIPFTPTPSEVAREIIDLQIALKNRNKSFLNNLDGARQATIDLTTGDASIDKYILRKLQENKTTFDTSNAANFEKDVNAVYVNLRKDYMVNHFNVVLKNFYDTQTLLIDEKADTWSFDTDGKAMFKSFINAIDDEIKKLNDEDTKIWQNKGLATVADYAATSSVLKLGEDLKKTAALSAEIAKLQAELATALAGNANELATALKNVDAKLKEYEAQTTKPITPVKPKPTPTPTIPTLKLTGTVSDAKVTLKWNKPANTINQTICYSQTKLIDLLNCSAQGDAEAILLDQQNSPAIVSKLTNAKKYYFVVTVEDEKGVVIPSNILTLTPKGEAFPKTGYTKIANDGSKLPDSAKLGTAPKDWACTRDNKTGLMWEVKTTDGGLRDMNNRYSWYEPDASKNGGNAGYKNNPYYGGSNSCKGSECDTYAFTNAVNTQGLCGAKDWRMPTKGELEGLVYCSDNQTKTLGKEESDYICTGSPSRPTINTTYFPDIKDNYWSSSPYANYSNYAWYVNFYDGYSYGYYKYDDDYVRLVR